MPLRVSDICRDQQLFVNVTVILAGGRTLGHWLPPAVELWYSKPTPTSSCLGERRQLHHAHLRGVGC